MSRTVISTLSPGLAESYLSSKVYSIGDRVLHANSYWERTVYTGIAGEWDQSQWSKIEAPLGKVSLKRDFDSSDPADYVDDFINGPALAGVIKEVVKELYDDAESTEYPTGDSSDES